MVDVAIPIVAAGHDDRGKWQTLRGHWRESGRGRTRKGGCSRVRHGHEQGATNPCRVSRGPMRDGQTSETVRHDDRLLPDGRELALYRLYPVITRYPVPIFDREAPPIRMCGLPKGLPVEWAGVADTGNDKNGGVHLLCLHESMNPSVKADELGQHLNSNELKDERIRNEEIRGGTQMKARPITLDRLDWRILEALQCNARITNTELGKQIGLSQPAVTARIKRLEEQGVIEGYAARVNPGLVGRGIAAIVRIRTTHAEIKRCLSAFAAMPEVVEAHRITGEDCFFVRILVEEMAQLEVAVDALAKFGPVTTSVVLASYPPKMIAGPKS